MSGETTNKLPLIMVVFAFISMSFILVYIFGPILILLLVLISGPILILYGDFLEEREKEAKKRNDVSFVVENYPKIKNHA